VTEEKNDCFVRIGKNAYNLIRLVDIINYGGEFRRRRLNLLISFQSPCGYSLKYCPLVYL
jgi:hypothetical protein